MSIDGGGGSEVPEASTVLPVVAGGLLGLRYLRRSRA